MKIKNSKQNFLLILVVLVHSATSYYLDSASFMNSTPGVTCGSVVTSDGAGQEKIIFFDAFPITSPILSPDIMNNHYPDYYEGGKKPPADWQSPRPILFLTVKETKFKFVLGIKPKDEKDNPKLLQKAIDLLNSALKEKGIGAKTAVGYGYMKT